MSTITTRLTFLGTVDLEDGACAIIVHGDVRWQLTFDDTGHVRWRRGEEAGQGILSTAELSAARVMRAACWTHRTATDFAPAQHTIPWWHWAVAIRIGSEVRTFQGDAYDAWAPREPVCDLVFFLRDHIRRAT